jgi:hypothetical protein
VSVDALLVRAQAAAEARRVDTCIIRRLTGEATSTASGVITPTYLTLYAGKCRLQQAIAQARQHDVGEDYTLLVRFELQLPMSVTGLLVSDEVTVTASRDADLVNRVFLIRDLFHKTDASARRVGVTERTD